MLLNLCNVSMWFFIILKRLYEIESKKIISYLPERTYLDKTMTVEKVIEYFEDFYDNFDTEKAKKLLEDLELDVKQKLSKITKGEL